MALLCCASSSTPWPLSRLLRRRDWHDVSNVLWPMPGRSVLPRRYRHVSPVPDRTVRLWHGPDHRQLQRRMLALCWLRVPRWFNDVHRRAVSCRQLPVVAVAAVCAVSGWPIRLCRGAVVVLVQRRVCCDSWKVLSGGRDVGDWIRVSPGKHVPRWRRCVVVHTVRGGYVQRRGWRGDVCRCLQRAAWYVLRGWHDVVDAERAMSRGKVQRR